MKRSLIPMVVAVMTCLCANALAEDAQAPFSCPERPDKPAKARKSAGILFSEAEQSFDQELYAQALQKFVCSMVMMEHENTVINIERTLEQVEDKAAALKILQLYTTRRPDGELKARMDEIIAKTGAAATPPKPEETPVCPEVRQLPPPPCPPSIAPALEIESREKAQKLAAVAGWSSIGVGAASFVTAIVMQALAGSAKNRAQSAVDYDVFIEEKDKNRSFQTAATTLFVTGVLTSAVGVVELFILSEQQRRYKAKKAQSGEQKDGPPPSSTVSLTPGIGRFALEVRF